MVAIDSIPSRICCAAELEIGVHASLFRWDSACWVIYQHRIQQIKSIVIQARDKRFSHVSVPFGKCRFVVWERCYPRPSVVVWCTQNPKMYQLWKPTWSLSLHLNILKISSISESPGKRGFLVHISANMQPIDHMSTPVEYCRPPRRISGARYHSVTTWLVHQ